MPLAAKQKHLGEWNAGGRPPSRGDERACSPTLTLTPRLLHFQHGWAEPSFVREKESRAEWGTLCCIPSALLDRPCRPGMGAGRVPASPQANLQSHIDRLHPWKPAEWPRWPWPCHIKWGSGGEGQSVIPVCRGQGTGHSQPPTAVPKAQLRAAGSPWGHLCRAVTYWHHG